MIEQTKTYQSISCSYYDQLEAFATKRSHCILVYRVDHSETISNGIIVDVFAQEGAEYLKLDTSTVIRLDHLISINGIPVDKIS